METWIDWQDIPPSADWLAEVYEAIEQSDSFIFIISETSVASEICGLEIAHAAKNNKRLVPIVINDIDAKIVPNELTMLNWIFFREEDEAYANAIQDLITAIQTDFNWVKEHTRLQNRALEWERKEHDRGLLLRGSDLSDGEVWLSQASEKDPKPTSLQTSFLLASRQDATRRQRITLGAVAAGLVVAIGLGILAWTQRNIAVSESNARGTAQAEAVAEAEMRATAQAEAMAEADARATQQSIAEEQSELALSRYLSAQSLTRTEDQLDLALLLAVQATRISPTTDARGSLFAALRTRLNLETILTKDKWDYVHDIGLSADGNTLAIGYHSSIQIWDLTDGKLITELALPEETDTYEGLTFFDNSERLLGCFHSQYGARYFAGTSCRIFDIRSGEDLGIKIKSFRAKLMYMKLSLAVSPDEKLVSVADEENHLYMYSLEDGVQIYGPLVGHDSRVTSATFNPDGTVLATGDEDGKVVLWDVITGTRIKRIRVLVEEEETGNHTVTGLAFSPDGTQLLAGGDGKSVIFNIETLALIKRFSSYDADHILAYFTPDSTPVVLIKREDSYELRNAFTGELMGGKPDTGFLYHIHDEAFNPIHMRLITLSGLWSDIGALVLTWDLNKRLPFERLIVQDEEFRSVAYHPDPSRSLLAIGSEKGGVFFWDSDTGEQIDETLQKNKPVYNLAFSPDGSLLAAATSNEEIVIWDVESLEPVGAPLSGHENTVYSLEFSPDGTLLASAGAWDPVPVRIWDLSQQTPTSEVLESEDEGPYFYDSLDFSPDGKMVTVSNADGVIIWDVTDRSLIAHLGRGLENPGGSAAIFSLDGRTLFSALTRGVRIWDYVNQEVLAEPQDLTMDPPAIAQIALSPDGQLLASVQFHAKLALWDGFNGQMLGTQIDIPDTVTVFNGDNMIAFSPDGDQLAIAGNFGILLWDMRIESWMEVACRMANRDLTPMEWRTFLGDLPYQETCPGLTD